MLGLIFFPGFIRIVSRVNDQSEGPWTYHNLKTVIISNSLVPLWDGEVVKYQFSLINDCHRPYLWASAAFNACCKSTYTRNQLNLVFKKASPQVRLCNIVIISYLLAWHSYFGGEFNFLIITCQP